MTIWERVREWGKLRGINSVEDQVQYQRFLQEAVEIHDAMINNDDKEFIDAIGDTIVTLINLANTKGLLAEDCLEAAFSIIEFRKGITTPRGDFVRYGKLDPMFKIICDKQQGNPDNEYYLPDADLKPEHFKRDQK